MRRITEGLRRKAASVVATNPGQAEYRLPPKMRDDLILAMARCERPILVTGLPRSGTTWLGKVLCEAPGAVYMHEPFNGGSGWSSFFPTPSNFLYIDAQKPSLFDLRIRRLTELAFPIADNPTQMERSAYNEIVRAGRATDGPVRPVLKDPIALLAAEWLAVRHDCAVAMLLRHPTHVAQSLTRLGWANRWLFLRFFTHQPDAVDRYLRADEFASLRMNEDMLPAERATIFVRGLLLVIRTLLEDHPDWAVVDHDDLVSDPSVAFRSLFDRFELTHPHETLASFDAGAAGVHDGTAHQSDLRPIPTNLPRRLHESDPDSDFGELWDTYLADISEELAGWVQWSRPT